jgi:hypothetical protein
MLHSSETIDDQLTLCKVLLEKLQESRMIIVTPTIFDERNTDKLKGEVK